MPGIDLSLVKVSEDAIAHGVGAVFDGKTNTYLLYGLNMPQVAFQDTINDTAAEEQNAVGTTIYNSTDTVLAPAVKSFQIKDCAYNILLRLPGYIPLAWASTGTGDQNITPTLAIIERQQARFKAERDRAYNLIMSINTGDTTIDVIQPGYDNVAASPY